MQVIQYPVIFFLIILNLLSSANSLFYHDFVAFSTGDSFHIIKAG